MADLIRGVCIHDYAPTKHVELSRGIASQFCDWIAPDDGHHTVLLFDDVALDNLTGEICTDLR